jgi:hypothetical protein
VHTYRFTGHSPADPEHERGRKEEKRWARAEADPITIFEDQVGVEATGGGSRGVHGAQRVGTCQRGEGAVGWLGCQWGLGPGAGRGRGCECDADVWWGVGVQVAKSLKISEAELEGCKAQATAVVKHSVSRVITRLGILPHAFIISCLEESSWLVCCRLSSRTLVPRRRASWPRSSSTPTPPTPTTTSATSRPSSHRSPVSQGGEQQGHDGIGEVPAQLGLLRGRVSRVCSGWGFNGPLVMVLMLLVLLRCSGDGAPRGAQELPGLRRLAPGQRPGDDHSHEPTTQ